MSKYTPCEIEVLKGKTLKKVEMGIDSIVFITSQNEKYEMFHEQDCCEMVLVEDICGDMLDLVGSPLVEAEKVSKIDEEAAESGTWTFYKLGTKKGSVTIRWYGSSNGYYSEEVDFGLREALNE